MVAVASLRAFLHLELHLHSQNLSVARASKFQLYHRRRWRPTPESHRESSLKLFSLKRDICVYANVSYLSNVFLVRRKANLLLLWQMNVRGTHITKEQSRTKKPARIHLI